MRNTIFAIKRKPRKNIFTLWMKARMKDVPSRIGNHYQFRYFFERLWIVHVVVWKGQGRQLSARTRKYNKNTATSLVPMTQWTERLAPPMCRCTAICRRRIFLWLFPSVRPNNRSNGLNGDRHKNRTRFRCIDAAGWLWPPFKSPEWPFSIADHENTLCWFKPEKPLTNLFRSRITILTENKCDWIVIPLKLLDELNAYSINTVFLAVIWKPSINE